MTSMSLRPLMGSPTEAPARAAKPRAVVSPWVWMAVTCLLLGLSGGLRMWREWTFSSLAVESSACPFPLEELPRAMGSWQATDSADVQLDPEVLRFAGASEHIVRNYVDQKTGEQASALVLYGLGTQVYGHVPEICYPAAGYQLFRGPIDDTMKVEGIDAPVHYRWAVYAKRVGGLVRYEEVYHAFLHHGDWLSDAEPRWKQFRRYPGLFKIQIAHAVAGLGEDGKVGPCVPLLTSFIQQISRRAAPGGASPATPTAGAAATAAN